MSDLISRQAAIDVVEKSRRLNHHQDGKVASNHEYEHRHFLKILRDLPPAEPQWIPVSKRLPEEKGLYVVTDSKGDVVRFVFEDTEMSREYWKRCAKAWMPSPKPYKGDKE